MNSNSSNDHIAPYRTLIYTYSLKLSLPSSISSPLPQTLHREMQGKGKLLLSFHFYSRIEMMIISGCCESSVVAIKEVFDEIDRCRY